MIKVRDFILPKGPLFTLLALAGGIIGLVSIVSWGIDDHTTINPRVACYGTGFDQKRVAITRILLSCEGGKKAYSDIPKVIARYAANPKAVVTCELRKSGDVTCDE